MNLLFFLIVVNFLKIIISRYFPLIGDEAYYWLWSKHLDLSYVDHPPMISYVNFFLTTIFGDNEFAIRLAAITIILFISGIIYLTSKELYGEKAGVYSVILFNLLPLFFGGGLLLVPQTLLFFFWTLSFYFLIKINQTNKAHYWYGLGIIMGLGMLSDYIMFLFPVGLGIYLFLSPKQRFWITKKEPYLCLVIALAIFSPVIFWNFLHHFPSLSYHGERAKGFNLQSILNFVILQMVLFTPFLFFETIRKIKHLDLLGIFSGVVFIPFALLSPFVTIGGHWPATAYLPSLVETKTLKKWTFAATVVFALFINALALTYYLFLYPTSPNLLPNSELKHFIKNLPPHTLIISNNLGLAALVAFHGKTKVYLPPGRHPQYDLWGKPNLKRGDNIVYFALDEPDLYEKLIPLFEKVEIDPQKRIFTKDSDIPTKTQIFIAKNFRGGDIP